MALLLGVGFGVADVVGLGRGEGVALGVGDVVTVGSGVGAALCFGVLPQADATNAQVIMSRGSRRSTEPGYVPPPPAPRRS
ncbi:MAG: hypothetical protein QOG53_3601 [Frankiales bacterium]|nr:hypothetical protein [Frankiales bacterium]